MADRSGCIIRFAGRSLLRYISKDVGPKVNVCICSINLQKPQQLCVQVQIEQIEIRAYEELRLFLGP